MNEFVISRVAAVVVKDEGRDHTLSEVISGLAWRLQGYHDQMAVRAMERDGLLYRSYDMKQGKRGRPRGVYHRTKNLKRLLEGIQRWVHGVPQLQDAQESMCRYEKRGMCKALLPKLQRCEPSLCPYLKPRSY